MATIPNKPAYPTTTCDEASLTQGGSYTDDRGLSIRDWFAGLALQGLLANGGLPWTGDDSYRNSLNNAAQKAVDAADALIEALNRK